MERVKAAVLEAPGRVVIKEFPLPAVGPEEGVLRIERAGVCSTDASLYQGKVGKYELPLILGHEMVGRIEALGEEAALKYGVRPGDRVVVEASVKCGQCQFCLTGNYKFCARGMGYGLKTRCDVPPHLWGAYAQFMYLAPGSVIHKISEEVPAEAAVLVTAVIANGIQWVRFQAGVNAGDVVVIQGMGPQALSAVIAAREAGVARVVVTGLARDAWKFALAREFGADAFVNVEEGEPVAQVLAQTGGRSADVVVDLTGSPAAINTSVEVIRKQGTIIQAGLVGIKEVPVPVDQIAFKEIRFQGVMSKGYRAVEAATALVESRKYAVEKLVTHTFPLAEAEQALRMASGKLPGSVPLKVSIDPWR